MTTVEDTGAAIRRRELAAFLRSRRERIAPERVGLPRGRRRRTPGLRREEVAHLSSVGVTWYTWLEQARDIQVSAAVLDALARTLLLDPGERAHLFTLAGAQDPTPDAESTGVPCELREVLLQLRHIPACVQNSRYDILAYNDAYGRLLCNLDAIPAEDRNCMLLAFTHPEWHRALVDREETIRLMAANYRAAMAGHIAEPAWKHLLKRLQRESAEFRELWARHEVRTTPASKTKRFLNPEVGLLHLHGTRLWLGPQPGPRLITYVPADEETRQRLHRLETLHPSGERPSAGSALAGSAPAGNAPAGHRGEWIP